MPRVTYYFIVVIMARALSTQITESIYLPYRFYLYVNITAETKIQRTGKYSLRYIYLQSFHFSPVDQHFTSTVTLSMYTCIEETESGVPTCDHFSRCGEKKIQ